MAKTFAHDDFEYDTFDRESGTYEVREGRRFLAYLGGRAGLCRVKRTFTAPVLIDGVRVDNQAIVETVSGLTFLNNERGDLLTFDTGYRTVAQSGIHSYASWPTIKPRRRGSIPFMIGER